jgi:hypothetical protein
MIEAADDEVRESYQFDVVTVDQGRAHHAASRIHSVYQSYANSAVPFHVRAASSRSASDTICRAISFQV